MEGYNEITGHVANQGHACAVKPELLKSWSGNLIIQDFHVLVLSKRDVGSGNEIARAWATQAWAWLAKTALQLAPLPVLLERPLRRLDLILNWHQ